MSNLNDLFHFLKSLTLLTFGQLAGIFGILFVFGLILYFLALSTRRVYTKSAGSFLDTIITGWIGTPVHETGHAIFCIIFFHRIEKISLFNPSPEEGTLGYVVHSYNKRNIWQRIGNFFIGVGPIVFGAVVLYLLAYFLLPEMKDVFSEISHHAGIINSMEFSNWQAGLQSLAASVKITLGALTGPDNFSHWQFWLFIYLSLSIASHMELSPSDLKSALLGFLNLALVIFLLNLLIAILELAGLGKLLWESWRYLRFETYAGSIVRLTGIATALFIYAAIISALNFVLSWLILSVYTLIRYKRVINPFWG